MNRRLHLVCLLLLFATFGVPGAAPAFAQQYAAQSLTASTALESVVAPLSTRPVAGRTFVPAPAARISRAATRTLTPAQQTAQVHAVTALRRTRA